ncbi:MAG: PEP-CTERM sorting domain-containing protein [Comamonadaceae bacterium]|uniref:PEP-CTERM sorting domain-containing protein n=1 Tax=Candidatus Skiveiella danica TaxID=3386177 RepID=UPI00390B9A5B|nr:PEP-CTERM sorting domain-containing protein [Comamonadaceae bacterium]
MTQIPYAVTAVWTEKDSTIPEPSTLSLMTLSLGVLFQSRRRLITSESMRKSSLTVTTFAFETGPTSVISG